MNQLMINSRTLSKRERMYQKHTKRQKLINTAQNVVNTYIVTPDEIQEKAIAAGRRKSRIAAAGCAMAATMQAMPAFASGGGGGTDGNAMFGTVKNTIDFLLQLLMGVGICFIAFGVISLAISFQSHDDSQKSKAVMAIVGGAIAICVRFVINFVVGDAEGADAFI